MSGARQRLFGILITLPLLAAPLWSTSASAQEPKSSAAPTQDHPISARAELVASTVPDELRARIEVELAQQLANLAEVHGFEITESHTPTLLLHIDVAQLDIRNPVYLVHASVFRDGALLERAEARTCVRCTPAEIAAMTLILLPRAVSLIAASPRKAPVEAPVEGPPEAIDMDELRKPVSASIRGPSPKTYVGLSLGALGLVGVIAGGVLLERGILPRPADKYDLTVINNTKPGAVLLGIGLGSMVAGLVLVALDVWGIASRSRRVALGGNGLQMGVRF